MTTPNLQPQQLFPSPGTLNPIPSIASSGSISILGFTLSRTQLYIIGAILVLIVGYFLWRWYKTREQFDPDSDDVNETDKKEEFKEFE